MKEVHSFIRIGIYATLRSLHIISEKTFQNKIEKYYSRIKKEIIQDETKIKPNEYGIIDNNVRNKPLMKNETIFILSPPHTEYIAKCICYILDKFNIKHNILFEYNEDVNDDNLYLIIAPNFFKNGLPKNYFAFNVEQSLSSNMFTKDYLAKLRGAYGVLDYSLSNIKFLKDSNISAEKLFYAKIAPCPDTSISIENKKTPILFYGSLRSKYRKNILNQLSKKIPIKILTKVFHEDIRRELDDTLIVLNLHYYDDAMLETTRICEAISHKCLVISETSRTDTEYPEFKDLVEFVPAGNVDAIEERLTYWLENKTALKAKINKNQENLANLFNKFQYLIARFLLCYDFVDFSLFYKHERNLFGVNKKNFYIYSPELYLRQCLQRLACNNESYLLPVLRADTEQQGRALTYKFISQCTLDENRPSLIVCEEHVAYDSYPSEHDFFMNADWEDLRDFVLSTSSSIHCSQIVVPESITVNTFYMFDSHAMKELSVLDEKDIANSIDIYLEARSQKHTALVCPISLSKNISTITIIDNPVVSYTGSH